jgi:putative endonuclease
MKDERRERGRAAEARVVASLEARGFCLVARNWRPTRGECPPELRGGEVDIVVERGAELWLIEVKLVNEERRQGASLPIVGYRQRRRLQVSRLLWMDRLRREGRRLIVRGALALVRGAAEPVEFIENCCYI